MPDERRAVVRAGYDEVAERYLAERTLDGADVELLAGFVNRVPAGARVLDAGCGAGVPVPRVLVAAGLAAVGLDLSLRQLELAQDLVPACGLVHGDLASLPLPDAFFDGVVSYYAIIHVPRDEHRNVFAEVRRVLRPGGWALLCLGAGDLPEDHDQDSWLGTAMYWSHFDATTNRELVREVGLDLVHDDVVPDPMGHRGHLFVLARRPGD